MSNTKIFKEIIKKFNNKLQDNINTPKFVLYSAHD